MNAARYLTLLLTSLMLLLLNSAQANQSGTNTFSHYAITHKAMVASDQHLATQVGLNILKQGGNAIDAAVAVAYALAVVHPCCGNIGGGGFMLMQLANGQFIFLNFREKAPIAASSALFLESNGSANSKKISKGYLSVGVPGTVLGLNTALKNYGTMTLAQVMAPAIALAEKGYLLTPGDVEFFSTVVNDFREQSNLAAIFLKNNQAYQTGDRLIQSNLAKSLQTISKKGSDAFYKGPLADKIVASTRANGGILTTKDFSQYSIEKLSPVSCQYRGYVIYSAPPPSSGGTILCEMLNILQAYPLKYDGFHTAKTIHYLAEAMRQAYADRNTQLGDPDFIQNPIDRLLSKEYASILRARILNVMAWPIQGKSSNTVESTHTTHYSIVDGLGNSVAMTYTIDSFFGSKVIASDTGFFLNNEMDDFTIKIGVPNQFGLEQGFANKIQPGKRPLSSMTPTIVTKDGKTVMVLGSPGGSTITTTVLQVLLNVIDHGMNLQQAIDAPRIHFQGQPNILFYEPGALSQLTQIELSLMGYTLETNNRWGAVQAISIDPNTHTLYGASDIRRPAAQAAGY